MSCPAALEPANDEELALRAQQGCAASFEQLLRRFQTPVLHFLQRRGFDADAEDLAQETFLRAYQNLHRYRSRWPFSAWLFTIARRMSINHRRRVRPATNEATAVDAAASAAAGPLDVLVASERRQRLWDTASRILSEEQTTALWLFYVEDMSVRDIAAVLGRSMASVKVLLFRARRTLQPFVAHDNERQPSESAAPEETRRRQSRAATMEAPHG